MMSCMRLLPLLTALAYQTLPQWPAPDAAAVIGLSWASLHACGRVARHHSSAYDDPDNCLQLSEPVLSAAFSKGGWHRVRCPLSQGG